MAIEYRFWRTNSLFVANSYADTYSDSHADAYPNSNTDAIPVADPKADADTNPHPYSDAY